MKSWRIRNKLDNEIKHLMERFGHLSNEISYFLETTHEVAAIIKDSLQKNKIKINDLIFPSSQILKGLSWTWTANRSHPYWPQNPFLEKNG